MAKRSRAGAGAAKPAARKDIDAAWLAEAHRRDARFRAGATNAKPVEEVIKRLASKRPRRGRK